MRVGPKSVINSLLAAVVTIQAIPEAPALPQCGYQIFSPALMSEGIRGRLAEFGLASPLVREHSSQNWRQHDILRAPDAIVGGMLYEKNLITRASSVTFRTSEDTPLLQATERVFACPEYRPNRTCYETTITMAFDGGQNSEEPPFQVVEGEFGVEFFRFGEPVLPIQWQLEFDAVLEWLTQYYSESVEVTHLALPVPEAAIQFAISADPLLMPYRDYIYVNLDRRGHYVLTGRLASHAQHTALLNKFFDIGIYNVQSWIVIDTGFRLPYHDLLPSLQSCY